MEISDAAEKMITIVGTGGGVMLIAKGLISSWLQRYEKTSDMVIEHNKQIAVHDHRLSTCEKDINGIGRKVRSDGPA